MTPDVSSVASMAPLVAWTLLHFLWQGAALWIGALCVLHLFKGIGPRARYAIYLVLFVLLAAAPVATLTCLVEQHGPAPRAAESRQIAFNESIGTAPPIPVEFHQILSPDRLPESLIREYAVLIVSFWLAGVAICAARVGLGAIGLRRIIRRRQLVPSQIERQIDRLAQRMAFRVRPAVYYVERLSQAMAVGILRPMVLLPAAWVTELSPEMLEAVLAHELAHLRRWDLPLNLLQRTVEAVLFFHPAVWWCSRRLRIEREMCCDEMAHRAIGDRVQYAQALTFLAAQQLSSSETMLGAGIGGAKMVLRERIRNVLGVTTLSQSKLYGPSCALAGAAVASLAWLALGGAQRGATADVEPRPEIAAAAPQPAKPTEPATLSTIAAPQATAVGREHYDAQKVSATAPTGSNPVSLPTYVVEPPDVLSIKTTNVVPKVPNFIDPGQQHISKYAVVGPDGNVDLGAYGQVYVSGMTLAEVRAAIEEHLSDFLEAPQVLVDVYSYNSKSYYIVTEGKLGGDQLQKIPITGNETVLDAICQVNGMSVASNKAIWVARPGSGDGSIESQILQVDWRAIVDSADTSTNWQLFPGDRVFISERNVVVEVIENVLESWEEHVRAKNAEAESY